MTLKSESPGLANALRLFQIAAVVLGFAAVVYQAGQMSARLNIVVERQSDLTGQMIRLQQETNSVIARFIAVEEKMKFMIEFKDQFPPKSP